MTFVPLPAYVCRMNSEQARLNDYRVIFEDGSSYVVEMAKNKTEARKLANKYLTDYCGYDGRHSGKRPRIMEIQSA